MHLASFKAIFLTFFMIVLTACGGGGSKPAPLLEGGVSSSLGLSSSSAIAISNSISSFSTLTVSSSVSSSSSISSSSVAAQCEHGVGDVFINSACTGWRGASVYERNTQDPAIFREIRDGSPGDLVTLQVIDSGVAGHNQVLDIQYNSRSPEFNGVVRMFNRESEPDGEDMSSYATGKLIFDVKVISRGDEAANLEVAIECGWPCNTHAQVVAVPQLNQWHTVEVSVKELIAEGLDIKHVTTGFLIAPAWGHQANAHFQVDNIRWVKGAPELAESTTCFANHLGFNDWDGGNNVYVLDLRSFAGVVNFDYNLWLEQIVPHINIRPQWDLVSGIWGFAISEPVDAATHQAIIFPRLGECAIAGTLSAQIYLPATYVSDGKMKVGLYVMDPNFNVHLFSDESLSAADMVPDGWTKIQVKLDNLAILSGARFTGVFFDPNGKPASVSGDIRVDNFVITHDATP